MRRAALLVVAAAMLVTAACSKGPTDQALVTEIKAKMFSDAQLKVSGLNVSAKDGVVTLAGEVPSEAARYQAYKFASEVPGVTRVEDKMTIAVAQAEPPAEPVEPARPARPAPAPVRVAPKPQAAPVKAEAPPPAPSPAPAPAAPAVASTPAAPEPPKPIEAEIPAGTELVIRMIDAIDTEVNKAGESFRASLDVPIAVDGNTVVPAGADVTVEIAEAKSAGRMAGRSELKLQIVKLELQGQTYALSTDTHAQQGASEGKQTATKVGIGAAAGAVIGAIAGGGKGAAIGATVGAGGGTAVSAAKKGEQIKVPSETRLRFTLQSPVTVTYLPEAKTRRR